MITFDKKHSPIYSSAEKSLLQNQSQLFVHCQTKALLSPVPLALKHSTPTKSKLIELAELWHSWLSCGIAGFQP